MTRVLVIGAGVVGLTTALQARRAGYEVVVVAERFAPDITSVVAPALAVENGVNPAAGVADAYTYLAPMVDTDAYLAWLRQQVERAGCGIVQARIDGDLAVREREILDAYDAHAIVNCTGLGSMALT